MRKNRKKHNTCGPDVDGCAQHISLSIAEFQPTDVLTDSLNLWCSESPRARSILDGRPLVLMRKPDSAFSQLRAFPGIIDRLFQHWRLGGPRPCPLQRLHVARGMLTCSSPWWYIALIRIRITDRMDRNGFYLC